MGKGSRDRDSASLLGAFESLGRSSVLELASCLDEDAAALIGRIRGRVPSLTCGGLAVGSRSGADLD
jgi:hypothetical protein